MEDYTRHQQQQQQNGSSSPTSVVAAAAAARIAGTAAGYAPPSDSPPMDSLQRGSSIDLVTIFIDKNKLTIAFPSDPHSVVPPSTTPHTTASVASSVAYTAAAAVTSSAAANHVASLAMGQSAMNGSSSQQLFQPTSSKSPGCALPVLICQFCPCVCYPSTARNLSITRVQLN